MIRVEGLDAGEVQVALFDSLLVYRHHPVMQAFDKMFLDCSEIFRRRFDAAQHGAQRLR